MSASQSEKRTYYQDVQVTNTGFLKVSDIHSIFWEESGNSQGVPVIVLHGGPGVGSQPVYRQFFDPSVYRIVQFDQRGCGKSTPSCCLEENTTMDQIADIEKIRSHLEIEKWHTVFGGSWGSTLSLAYSQAHPEKVSHLILRGVFLGRKWENDYIYQNGTNKIFPDQYDSFKNQLPKEEQGDILANYYKRLTSKNISNEQKLTLAREWVKWEFNASKLYIDPNELQKFLECEKEILQLAYLETHYLSNYCFMRNDNQLIEDCSKIKHIPTIIVQGRYDAICPPQSAWDIHKQLPLSELNMVPCAGHSCTEPGLVDCLVKATDKFKLNH